MLRLTSVSVGVVLLASLAAADGGQFVIAEDGQARAVIIRPDRYESE